MNVRNQIWPSIFLFGSWPWPWIYLRNNDLIAAKCKTNVAVCWANSSWYNEPPQAWLTFGHAPLNFGGFLATDHSSSFHALQTNCWLDKAQISQANLLWAFSSLIDFWSCSTEFRLFPGLWLITNGWTDGWISFHAFGDKPLIWLRSNLVGKKIKVLSWPDLLTLGCAPLNSCSFMASNIWGILVPLLLPLSMSLVRAQFCLGREDIHNNA